MQTRGSRKVHEEKGRKKFVGQQLGLTPKSWLTPKSSLLIWFFVILLYAHILCCMKIIVLSHWAVAGTVL